MSGQWVCPGTGGVVVVCMSVYAHTVLTWLGVFPGWVNPERGEEVDSAPPWELTWPRVEQQMKPGDTESAWPASRQGGSGGPPGAAARSQHPRQTAQESPVCATGPGVCLPPTRVQDSVSGPSVPVSVAAVWHRGCVGGMAANPQHPPSLWESRRLQGEQRASLSPTPGRSFSQGVSP